MSNKVNAAQIAARLRASERILLLTHVSPDGDTLGSAYGLKHALPDQQVDIVCDDTVGEWISFLCVPSLPLRYHEVNAQDYDLVVSIDVAEFARLGEGAQSLGREVDIKIDHHETGKPFSKEELVLPDAAACAEIIYDIVCALGTMNPLCATALYAALSSDTGGFRYSNTTKGTHDRAAALVEMGIDVAELSYRLFEAKSLAQLRAEHAGFEAMHLYESGKIAIITVPYDTMQALELRPEHVGTLVDIARSVAGVEVAVAIRQTTAEPVFRVSMRANIDFDVSAVAAGFGGGGHRRAAGATVQAADAVQAEAKVLEAIRAAMA